MLSRIEAIKDIEKGFLVRLGNDPQLEPFNIQAFDETARNAIGRNRLHVAEYTFYYLVEDTRQGDTMAIMLASSVRDHSEMNRKLADNRTLAGILKSYGQINIRFIRDSVARDRIMQGGSQSLKNKLTLKESDQYRKSVIEPLFGKAFIYHYLSERVSRFPR